MTNVVDFPEQPLDPDEIRAFHTAMTRPLLTPDQLHTGPIDAITEPGPLVIDDGPTEQTLTRIHAITSALLGLSRFTVTAAAPVLKALATQLETPETLEGDAV